LMYSVYANPKRNGTDILISGLCSGCLLMSVTCGTQCLLSMIHGRFYGGDLACQIEAIAHVSSILTQFFCVAGIAIRSYLLVVRKYDLATSLALKITVSVWVVCIVLTGLFSLFSPIYLMSNGTYCFFGFSSFAIAGWLLPGLVVALGVMCVCYCRIWQEFKRTTLIMEAALRILGPRAEDSCSGEATPSTRGTSRSTASRSLTENARRDISHVAVARRSALFIVILLLGWGFAAVTAIYELTVGQATEWLVTAVGVGGVSHSWWVPIMYAYTSDFHKKTMKKLFGWMLIPLRGKAWWREAWAGKRPASQESTGSLSDESSHRPQDSSVRLDSLRVGIDASNGGSRSPVYTSHKHRHTRSASPSYARSPPASAITCTTVVTEMVVTTEVPPPLSPEPAPSAESVQVTDEESVPGFAVSPFLAMEESVESVVVVPQFAVGESVPHLASVAPHRRSID